MIRPVIPALALLVLPTAAWAGGTVVLTPLVPKDLDAKVAKNVTSLIGAELDFAGEFDNVTELSTMPATMNLGCLTNAGCLAGIAVANDGQKLMAGSLSPGPEGLQVTLVYVDAETKKILGKGVFDVAKDPGTLATEAGKWVKAVLAGGSAEAAPVSKASSGAGGSAKSAAAASAPPKGSLEDAPDADSFSDEGDEFAFDAPSKKPKKDPAAEAKARARAEADDLARQRAESAARAKAEAEEKARLAAEQKVRQAAEVKARAEELARQKAEAAALARAEAEEAARAKAEAAQARADAEAAARAKADAARSSGRKPTVPKAEEPAEDEEDFEFGSATSMISVESAADDKPAARASSSKGSTSKAGTSRTSSYDDEDEDAPPARSSTKSTSRSSSYDEEDEDAPPARSSTKSTSRASSYDEEEEDAPPARSSTKSTSRSSRYDEEEEDAPPARRTSSSSRSSRDDEDMDTRSSRSTGSSKSRGDDLDEDRGSSSRSRDDDRRSSSKYDSREEDEGATGMGLSARLGTARMGTLGFVTWGGELDVPVATALHLVAGVEGYSTKRDFTEDERAFIAEEQGIAPEQVPAWNTILPLNAGIAWRPGTGTVRPYLGADLTITPYTANFDIAVGARARGGLDVMVARNFGFNLNVAAGVVSGSKLAETQEGFQNTNLVPQFSAGTVARF